MTNNLQYLLSQFATNSLTEEETQALREAARQDESVFTELAQLAPVRAIFMSAAGRASAREALSQVRLGASRSTRAPRLQWETYAVLAIAAMLIVGVFAVLQHNRAVIRLNPESELGSSPAGMRTTEPKDKLNEYLNKLNVKAPTSGASFSFDRGAKPTYRIGDPMRIAFSLPFEATIYLLDVPQAGQPVLLSGESFAATPGEKVFVPASGRGNLHAAGPAGLKHIRLVALPRGLAGSTLNQESTDQALVVWDIPYQVVE
jgi:hypothetical protein